MPGGRPKGSRNKKSAGLRHVLQKGFDPIEFLSTLAQDESEDMRVRLDATKTLLPYVLPRLNALAIRAPFDMNSWNGDPASSPTSYLMDLYEEAVIQGDPEVRQMAIENGKSKLRKTRPWEKAKAVNGKAN